MEESAQRRGWHILPHEYAFNAFVVLVAARLALADAAGSRYFAVMALCLVVSIGLIAWGERKPTKTRWRVRLIWYPWLMASVFYSLAGIVKLFGTASADALLAQWDIAMLGAPAARYLGPLQSAWLTEIMMVSYLFFFYYLVFGPFHYFLHDLPRFRACMAGLFTLYPIGFLGYTLLPAAGPYSDPSLGPLQGMLITELMEPLVRAGSNKVDVFPSIHAAVSLYLLVFDFWHHRRRFWILLLPTLALWLSTVYLRYHYVVDLAAGLVLTLIGLAVARGYAGSALARAVDERAARHQ